MQEVERKKYFFANMKKKKKGLVTAIGPSRAVDRKRIFFNIGLNQTTENWEGYNLTISNNYTLMVTKIEHNSMPKDFTRIAYYPPIQDLNH